MTGRPSIALLTAKASLLYTLEVLCGLDDEKQARSKDVGVGC